MNVLSEPVKSGHVTHTIVRSEHQLTVCLTGPLDRSSVPVLMSAIAPLQREQTAIVLDLAAVTTIDSAGIALLLNLCSKSGQARCSLLENSVSDYLRRAIELYSRTGHDRAPDLDARGFFERIGEQYVQRWASFSAFIYLAADCSVETFKGLFRKGMVRWNEVMTQTVLIGSQALPIVALIALLVGLTLAFQSAYQLRIFGADVFVAQMTGIAMVREMGPLMTAILVAGRSGSSIAAEIATMKVSEEVDALQVMGIDPRLYLAAPRVLAIVTMVPLLTVFAITVGILGGFIVGVFYVDLAPVSYLTQTIDSLVLKDLISSLLKSMVFAWGIGMIGLYYGFSVRGGAEEVGKATTTSVVVSIFYIIAMDCIFSIVFYVLI